MTSNCSFIKVMKEEAKRRGWLFILSAYLYLTCLIDFMLAQSGQVLIMGDKRLGPGNHAVLLMTGLLAVICAFQGFSYLFSEDKTDFYLCLPVKRSRLFLAGYVNGVLTAMIPCVLTRLICYFIEGSRSHDALYVTWMGILMNFLGFLLLYSLVLCIILLAGHILIAAAGTAILFFYGTFALGIVIERYSSTFFKTYYRINIMDKLSIFTSPYKLYGTMCGTDSTADIGDWNFAPHLPYFITALIVTALALLLAYQLFKHRPAEAAGRALAFDKAKGIVKFILAIPTVLIIGYYIMLCSPSSRSFLLLAIGIIFGAFTVNGLLEIILQFDLHGMLSGKKQFLAMCVVCLLIVGSFSFDVWNYDSYAPKPKDVHSAAIFIRGLDDSTYTGVPDSDFGASEADTQLFAMQLKGADKEHLLNWISEVRKESYPAETPVTYAAVAYRLSGGRTVYRKYPIYSADDILTFHSVYKSGAYKKGAFPAIDHKSPGVRHYLWSNGIESLHLDLTEEENEHLMKLITSDLTKLTIDDIRNELPIGTLSLVYDTYDSGESAPLYPSFSGTLQYLEDIGIPVRKAIGDYEITQIKLYEKEVKTSAFGKVTTSKNLIMNTKEQSEIKKLAADMLPVGYDFNQLMNPLDTTYEATVSWRNSTGHTISYAAMSAIQN